MSAWKTKDAQRPHAQMVIIGSGVLWLHIDNLLIAARLTPSSVPRSEAVIQHHYSKRIPLKLLFGHE